MDALNIQIIQDSYRSCGQRVPSEHEIIAGEFDRREQENYERNTYLMNYSNIMAEMP